MARTSRAAACVASVGLGKLSRTGMPDKAQEESAMNAKWAIVAIVVIALGIALWASDKIT